MDILHSTICSPVPKASKIRGPVALCQFSFCELDLFPRESMAKKKDKKWEGDGVQTGFIRIGLGHVLGFSS